MGQPSKDWRDLVGVRLAHEVYETLKDVAPDRHMGPYAADLIAMWFGRPDLVTDWRTVGALPTTRPVYDAVFTAAAERNVSPMDLLASLVAEGLGRPELLHKQAAPEQEVLPLGDDAAA